MNGMDQEPIGCGELAQILCNCWVATMPEEDRFSIRYGAHNPACPQYRESGDPVDRVNDEELRARFDIHNRCDGGGQTPCPNTPRIEGKRYCAPCLVKVNQINETQA
jgi:hypothetical protein